MGTGRHGKSEKKGCATLVSEVFDHKCEEVDTGRSTQFEGAKLLPRKFPRWAWPMSFQSFVQQARQYRQKFRRTSFSLRSREGFRQYGGAEHETVAASQVLKPLTSRY